MIKRSIMKKIVHLIVVVLLSASISISCDDMNSAHQEFLDRGENVIVGIPIILGAFPGFGQAELWLIVNNDPKIVETRVYWTDFDANPDSISAPIDRTNAIMQVKVPLPEGQYALRVVNLTASGDRSLTTTISVESFGETFQSNLLNRGMNLYVFDAADSQLEITWSSSVLENAIGTEITYHTATGVVIDTIAKPNEPFNNRTVLQDIVRDSEFTHRTLYLPDNSIDTIATVPVSFTVIANKYSEPMLGPHTLSAAEPYFLHIFNYDIGFPVSLNYTYGTPKTAANTFGTNYRRDNGDAEGTRLGFEGGSPPDAGNIGAIAVNEWFIYTVYVQDAGNYRVTTAAAASAAVGTLSAGRYRLEVNGEPIGNSGQVPGTGAWGNYAPADYPELLPLTQGENRLRFFVEAAGFNVRSMTFTFVP